MLIKHELILRDELAKPAYAAQIAAGAWQAIADALNTRASVPNPTPRPTVPKRLSVKEFVGLLKAAEVWTIYANANIITAYGNALESGDRALAKSLYRGMKSQLSAETQAAIEAAQDATELDPTWSANVLAPSLAMTLGLPTVSAEDVQFVAFRHLGGA